MLTLRIRSYERGFHFRNDEFVGVLGPGRYWFATLAKERVDVVSTRNAWINHKDLDLIAKSGKLTGKVILVDLKDSQRGLLWFDGRFEAILGPGLYGFWTEFKEVRVEVVEVESVRFVHTELASILASRNAETLLSSNVVQDGYVGLFYQDGILKETLGPGQYAFWKGTGVTRFFQVDLREAVLDVTGQEIMTADKVTLRLNALVTFRVKDARQALSQVEDYRQALYREAQLALRALIGTRELDQLLSDKDIVSRELMELVQKRAETFGVEIRSIGIRDVILPGEIRELLNKVTEAKKAAEAAIITRREETAAMRSQANTAKLLESNPVLMKLRELEALERIAERSKLSVVLGEKGLTDKIVNLL